MNGQARYNFEYEANGHKIVIKNKTLEEINAFINQLKAEKESSMTMKRIREESEEER